MNELKIYIEVMCHDNEEWCKIWGGIDLPFQNWHEEFDELWLEHSAVSKIFTVLSSFWTKFIMFELKQYRRVIFHDTEEWSKIWRKTDLWFRKWRDEFGNILSEHSKVSNLGLWWDRFIRSKKWMSLKCTNELYVRTIKNEMGNLTNFRRSKNSDLILEI